MIVGFFEKLIENVVVLFVRIDVNDFGFFEEILVDESFCDGFSVC